MDIQLSVQRLLLGAAIAVISLGTQGAELVGQVVAVADGDTLTVLDGERRQYRVRLQGIDAPEKGQDYWRVSKQSLADRVTVRRKQVPEACHGYTNQLSPVEFERQHFLNNRTV